MHGLFEQLKERGFIQDATPGLAERLTEGPITAYVGFDPTAESLHVGNLVPVMGLAWLQRLGGTPIILIGGGTGMVGDPSGKRTERPILSVEQVDANARAIRAQLEHFLSFDGKNSARLRNNADWLRPLNLLEFLRDTGKHFTVNYMLQKESVKSRMDSGISFTEFSYMLVQAYDFLHLYQTEHCELQMGGSDQWGNITAGTELIGRRDGKKAHGLVFPLITTASGAKFGKSEEGNVWLDPSRTSPYAFYQFWLNTDDRDVERCLSFFTFMPMKEIESILAAQAKAPGERPAQRRIAEEVTGLVHGAETTRRVIAASRLRFGGMNVREAEPEVFALLADEIPTFRASRSAVTSMSLVDALVSAGLAKSKSEARRGIEGKGFSLNSEPITDVNRTLGTDDLLAGGYALLQKGRKNFALLVTTT